MSLVKAYKTTPIFRDHFGVWPERFSILSYVIKPTSKDTHQVFAVYFKTSMANTPYIKKGLVNIIYTDSMNKA